LCKYSRRFPGVGLSTTAICSIFDGYFSDTFEMRLALLYGDMQSVVGFSVVPKCITLNDLEWLPYLTLPYLWGGCTRHTSAEASMRNPDGPHGQRNLLEAFANLRRTVQWIPLRVSSESVLSPRIDLRSSIVVLH